MGAWGTSQDPTGKSGIRFLADPHGELTSALDLSFDSAAIFGNARSKRYALVVENGKVTQAHVEPDNTGLNGMVYIPLELGARARTACKCCIRLTYEQSALPRRFLEALRYGNDGQISHFDEWSLNIFRTDSLRSDQLYISERLVLVKNRRIGSLSPKTMKSPFQLQSYRKTTPTPNGYSIILGPILNCRDSSSKMVYKAKRKTYNRRDSQMVTHSSTSRPVQCLCMAERTGCPVLTDLWSYVSCDVDRNLMEWICTKRFASVKLIHHRLKIGHRRFSRVTRRT